MHFAFMKYAVDVTCSKFLGEQDSNNVEDFDCRVYFTVILCCPFCSIVTLGKTLASYYSLVIFLS